MTWWLGLDRIVQRVIIAGALVCAIVALSLLVGYCSSREEVARARHDATVADRQAGLGADAAKTTAGQVQAEADNAAQTGRNREEIMNAPNASETAGAAGDAGLRALCRRVSYRDSERCAELRRADRADASR